MSSNLETFVTLVMLIAVSLDAVAGQTCPVKDNGCSCDDSAARINCAGLGNRDQVPPFEDSDDTFNWFTIGSGTTIQTVQDNAFANVRIKTIVLSNLQIKTLSELAFRGKIETVLERIELDGNNIAVIPPGTFQNLTKLNYLSITSNEIATLDPDTFRGLPSLSIVYLYLNELSSLPDGLFRDCTALSQLSLFSNRLSWLSAMTFGRLPALYELQLYNNRIDSIESGTFRLLPLLNILNLRNNAIQTVNASTFLGLQNLTSLDLSSNSISIVPGDTFQDLTALRSLNLANNMVQDLTVETFANLRNLATLLDLTGNALRTVPDNIFAGLSKLQKLYLGLNDFHIVNATTLLGLGSLTSLQLNDNSIQELPAGLLQSTPNLTVVDLSRNSIRGIVPGTFDNCLKLTSISLSFNKLEGITPHVFEDLPVLAQLYLDHNAIPSLKGGTFSNLPKINYLDISYNNITGIDDGAFVNIPTLGTLSLDGNGLVTVPVSTLNQIPNLSVLSLNWNEIAGITDNTFAGLRSLTRLLLSYNSLTLLETRAFAGLTKLSTLLLQNNSICSLHPGLFDSFKNGSLTQLNLGGNCIANISGAPFSSLQKLSILNLSDNNLTEITWDAFAGLTAVTSIDLDSNRISVIDPLAFSNLTALTTLSMFGNLLTPETLISISNLPKLQTLQLSQNLIDRVPDDSFANCDSLAELDLRNNNLTRIGSIGAAYGVLTKFDLGLNRLNTSDGIKDLVQFTKLGTLKLDGNAIDDALLGNVTVLFQRNQITELDLSSNKLSSAVFSMIQGLSSLTTLRVDNNRIESLGGQGVDLSLLAKTVTTFSASNNRLTGTSLSLLANFTVLNYLNLDGNLIDFIPSGLFRSMFNLGTLSLNRNRLTALRNDTFGELTDKISSVFLADNQIALAETGAMLPVTQLKQLDLSGNLLTTITLPEAMSQLQNLNLSRNRLASFPLGLRTFPLLNSIDLSQNLIGVLPALSIYSTVQMRLLDFSRNRIENVDDTTYVGVIDRLNFSRNLLTDVQTLIFRRVTSANLVDFSSNKFQRVPAAISGSHAVATVVDLAFDLNQISNLSDWVGNGSMFQSRIERLSLRGNRIADVPRVVIESLNASLVELDVRDNQLVYLTEATFAGADHLARLDLEGNPLRCDCTLGWLRRLKLRVDVGPATCATPEWLSGQLAVCYNISTCDDIDPELQSIDLNDTCLELTSRSVPKFSSTATPSFPAPSSTTPPNPATPSFPAPSSTTPPNPATPSFPASSSTTPPNPTSQEPSLPYNRDGLIAGVVCGGVAFLVIIGCAAYWIRDRLVKRARSKQEVSTISSGAILYNNPGFSKL